MPGHAVQRRRQDVHGELLYKLHNAAVARLRDNHQRRVSEWWLEKDGGLVDGVEFDFLADDGTLDQRR